MRHGAKGSYARNETSRQSTPPPSVPTYNTPGALLKAAAGMGEEEARELLLRELQRRGWKYGSLEMIVPDSRFRISWPKPQVAYWIERFNCVFTHISDLSFEDWEHLAALWCSAIDATNEGDDVKALEFARGSDKIWGTPSHARRVRFWLLGNFWTNMVIEAPISDTLAVWFRDFRAQCEAERSVLRRLWHDDHEQGEFDALPEEVLLHHSFRSAPLVAGLSLYDELDTSLAYETHVALRDPTSPVLGRPHVESLLAGKNLIIGLKKVLGPCEEDLSLHAVTLPWTEGRDMIPILDL